MRAIGAAIGVGLLLATAVHAAPASVKVKVAITLDGAAPGEPSVRAASAARPELDVEQVLPLEELDAIPRSEQEALLAQLIADTPDSDVDEKSHYYFMLAVLQTQQHRSWRQKSAELALRADREKSAKTKAEATAAAERTTRYLEKAVRSYKALTERDLFRNFAKRDTALFYYGYTLQQSGHPTEARQVFHKLIKDHPASKHVPTAYVVFGDHFFGQGQLADAESMYKVVLRSPRSQAYWYAMYKLGWIHLGQQRFQEALETFFQIVQSTKSDQKLEGLSRASLNDFVRAYAEIGKPDKAHAAFQRVDGPRAQGMLQDLARFYLEQGKSDRAIYVYQELIKRAPWDQDVCPWQSDLARAIAVNAVQTQMVEVCAEDVDALKGWARDNGVRVTCPSCGRGARGAKLP